MNIEWEAKKILYEHTTSCMSCGEVEAKSNEELWEFMVDNCGYMVAENLLSGKYTPMQYIAVCNEVGRLLDEIFNEPINQERLAKRAKACYT